MTSKPLDRWASSDVLAAVVDVEIAALLGRTPSKDEALLALAARRELEDRMRRHRWLAMETARKAGASWAELAAAAGMDTSVARRLYEQTLARQKAFGYVEAAADMLLTHPDVVLLTCPDRPEARHGGSRYSTWWTLQTEQAVLDVVEHGRTAGVAVAATYPATVDNQLGVDQAEAVRRIVAGGERVEVLVGPAGSGKSRTLRAARQAWQQAGVRVRGVAPSAVAAGVLTEEAGIPSDTLAKFLLEVANRRSTLTPGEVIVCDEESMVSTRDLARLVLLADTAGAKIVLVGDHYQLGSVDAGGLFRLLAADAKTAELTGVRRFSDPWEAQATRRLRRGDGSVVDEYIDRDRIRSGDRDQVLEAAHQTWTKPGITDGRWWSWPPITTPSTNSPCEPAPPASMPAKSRQTGSPSATRSSPPATTAAWSPPLAPGSETATAGPSTSATKAALYGCDLSTAAGPSQSPVTTSTIMSPSPMPSPSTAARTSQSTRRCSSSTARPAPSTSTSA